LLIWFVVVFSEENNRAKVKKEKTIKIDEKWMKIVKEWLITCYWLVTVERRNWCEEFQPPWKEWREFCLLWIYELLWTCWLILEKRIYDKTERCEWMNE
jgi:hypothetical protein